MTAEEILEAKEQVIRAGKELAASGLIARTWGNISARISDTQFVITPSGRAYETLTPDDIVIVNIADCSYEGDIKPSSEKGVHAAAYRNRKEVNFVIHTHQYYATSLSTLAKTIDVAGILPEAVKVLGSRVPTAAYGLSSTKTLTANVEKTIQQFPGSRAILMRNHGTVCMGRDYDDAFCIANTLEQAAKKSYLGIVGGCAPEDEDPEYSLTKHMKIYHREINEEYDAYYEIFSSYKDINFVVETDAPYIKQYSAFGKPLMPYVDDLAQFAGIIMECLPETATKKQIRGSVTQTNNIILIKGKGAICTAATEDDAEAIVMVLDKGCQAALLERSGAHPLVVNPAGGVLEHILYIRKYSKLKK